MEQRIRALLKTRMERDKATAKRNLLFNQEAQIEALYTQYAADVNRALKLVLSNAVNYTNVQFQQAVIDRLLRSQLIQQSNMDLGAFTLLVHDVFRSCALGGKVEGVEQKPVTAFLKQEPRSLTVPAQLANTKKREETATMRRQQPNNKNNSGGGGTATTNEPEVIDLTASDDEQDGSEIFMTHVPNFQNRNLQPKLSTTRVGNVKKESADQQPIPLPNNNNNTAAEDEQDCDCSQCLGLAAGDDSPMDQQQPIQGLAGDDVKFSPKMRFNSMVGIENESNPFISVAPNEVHELPSTSGYQGKRSNDTMPSPQPVISPPKRACIDQQVSFGPSSSNASSISGATRASSSPIANNIEDTIGIDTYSQYMNKIKTIRVGCNFEGCRTLIANREQFQLHLANVHQVLPYKCTFEGCNQRFGNQYNFGPHIRDAHVGQQWRCVPCGYLSFENYRQLSMHNYALHEEGLYMCGQEGCNFEASLRIQVMMHIKRRHKQSSSKMATNKQAIRGSAGTSGSLLARPVAVSASAKQKVMRSSGARGETSLIQQQQQEPQASSSSSSSPNNNPPTDTVVAFDCRKCTFSCDYFNHMVAHIRTVHFSPSTNVYNYQPNDYIREVRRVVVKKSNNN